MKGDAKVVEFLNRGLRHELTAINQYWLHYRLLDNWGLNAAGERQAAAAAIERVRTVLNASIRTQPPPEMRFSMADQWQRQLFCALCRRHGLEPYRYKGQRYNTVMVRAPESFIDNTLWPEYLELQAALDEYLADATERIIREEVYRDAREANEQAG